MKRKFLILAILIPLSSSWAGERIDENYLVIKSRSPVLRFGLTGSNYLLQFGKDLKAKDYKGFMGGFLDWNMKKWRGINPHRTEIYSRFSYRRFKSDKDLSKNINWNTTIDTSAVALGIRYGYCLNASSILLRPYIQCHLEGASLYEHARDEDKTSHYFGGGAVGGLGIEVAPFKNFGIFGEYNYGYVPVESKKSNLEGHQVWFGCSLRTR